MDKWLSIAIVFATLIGPILAVLVTRSIDRANRQRERRTEVLRLLMSARRGLMSPDNVKGLNMVEIDFHGEPAVLRAYSELISHLNSPGQDHAAPGRYLTLLTRLLSEMAVTLGYRLQQLDVLEGGYYPQRFVDIENEQQEVRRALIEVLQRSVSTTLGQLGWQFRLGSVGLTARRVGWWRALRLGLGWSRVGFGSCRSRLA